MRTAALYLLLISFIMYSSTCSGVTRQKRNLSFIKRLLSNNIGSEQKCTETPRKTSTGYDTFITPYRESVVEPVSEITRQLQNKNDENYFLKIIRQFITSITFQDVSQDLRELIGAKREDSTSQVSNKIVEDVSNQPIQNLSQDLMKVNQKSIPVLEISRPLLKETVYEKPQMSNDLPSIMNFVNSILYMPRKYSYEQIKEQTVEKFMLNNNNDVIVTETRKTMPRPAHIDDRIKEVILRDPISASRTKLVDQKLKPLPSLMQHSYVPNSYGNRIFMNNQKDENPIRSVIIDQKNSLVNFEPEKVIKKNEDIVTEPSKVLQQNFDQAWNSIRSSDIILAKSQKQLNLKPSKLPNIIDVVADKVEPAIFHKDNECKNNENIQTRYMYQQNTGNGTLNYGGTSLVTYEQLDEKYDSKGTLNISAYTGKPIVVTSLNGTKNIYSLTLSDYNNEVYINLENNIKEKTRGDIPD